MRVWGIPARASRTLTAPAGRGSRRSRMARRAPSSPAARNTCPARSTRDPGAGSRSRAGTARLPTRGRARCSRGLGLPSSKGSPGRTLWTAYTLRPGRPGDSGRRAVDLVDGAGRFLPRPRAQDPGRRVRGSSCRWASRMRSRRRSASRRSARPSPPPTSPRGGGRDHPRAGSLAIAAPRASAALCGRLQARLARHRGGVTGASLRLPPLSARQREVRAVGRSRSPSVTAGGRRPWS